MKAAVAARQGSDLKILAVTVLTSYDDIDLAEAGYATSVDALVARRAQQAHDLGVDGLVCSPEEASPLRLVVGHDMVLVTPGIRPAGAARGDQKRVMTPAQAIAAGADYLVVGRPITGAPIRRRPREAIVAEIARGSEVKGEHACQGLLDRARRCEQSGGLQGLRGGQCRRFQEIRRRDSSCAAGKFEAPEGDAALAQRRDRISRLRGRARLLPLARISGEHQGARAAFGRRYRDHRGL